MPDIKEELIGVNIPLPPLEPLSNCLFLDFDGTMVEIADHPRNVSVARSTLSALATIHRRLAGAVAIVSGRSTEDIDQFLNPLTLPVAGVHGLTRRSATGALDMADFDQSVASDTIDALQTIIGSVPGVFIETKWGAVALHYRARPELEEKCIAMMRETALARTSRVEIVCSKMVVEAKFSNRTKGTAVEQFMREAPFAGRRPVFIGDDLTDEDGFAAVHSFGGLSAKIGPGKSIALHRFPETRAFLKWFEVEAHQGAERS